MEKIDQGIIDFKKIFNGLAALLFLLSALFPFELRAEAFKIISDEETEQFLNSIVKSLFKAGGIAFHEGNVFIVEDNSLNAFVADGNSLFIHTGTITKADNSNELVGVIAHETGHIMGGHIVRQKLKMEKLQYVMI